ncbi:MAG: hypothetical protein CVU44_11285 [Chloroflexi bacterium HGW-Chloroflexi-6]|nr:MAG: hypothetical protein CVU44_11285 [Chloroflexi bacterium HGW-Chloroflexi-6]
MKEPKEKQAKDKAPIKLSDLFFAFGYLMLFAGLWLCAGLGLALTVCGSLLLALGVLSAWLSAPRIGGVDA